jgi:hypothetical protein
VTVKILGVTKLSMQQGIRLYTHPAQDGAVSDNQM